MAEASNESLGMNVSVLQANCQHAYGVMCDLGQYVLRDGISICLFQEPYVYEGKVCGLPAGTRVFVSKSGGAAVAVFDRAYECMSVEECKFVDGVCVWLKGPIGEMLVVSLYCRPNGCLDESIAYLNEVLRVANGTNVLVGMDANASSDLWFSKNAGRNFNSLRRAEVLEEWIVERGMEVLNVPSRAYTFSGARGESDVDVTLYKGEAADFEWKVMEDWGVSDHNPIVVRMSMSGTARRMLGERVKKWKTRECDWKKYGCLIRSSASGFGYDKYLELGAGDRVGLFYEWVFEANDACMKRVNGGSGRKADGVVWWTADLERKKKEVQRARKAFQKERRLTGDCERVKWKEWKASMREYKQMMKAAKESDWHEFVRKESANDPWGKVYKICMGRMERSSLSGVRTSNGWTRTWKESANALMDEFFPPDDGVPIPSTGESEYVPDIFCEFGVDELERAVHRMKMGKTPGMDGITNEMIWRAWLVVPEFLKAMYDSCLKEGLFPKPWKEARVVALLKGPDKDRAEPRSYRPISLLSGLGKVLERMLVERLMNHMAGKWNDCQYGFMNGRCTEDAWMRMKEMVNQSNAKNVIGMFVDFKGAFDYLLWRVIMENLCKAGCTMEEVRMWRDYFKDRWVYMCNGMEEVRKKVERGCPQGSIGGPPVWNLCINDLLNLLNEMGVQVVAYADDLLLLVEGRTRYEVEGRASEVMKAVYGWGKQVGVEVSDSKTVCMVLKGGMNMLNRRVHVRLSEDDVRKIKFVECVKYLGVNMAVDMDFKVHVYGLRKRVIGTIWKLKRVLRKEWGLKKRILSVIVKGLLLPAIMYGASVWYELTRKKGVCMELNRCQRHMLYACTRVCRTVSTEAMQVLFGSLPWDLECLRQADRYKVRKGMPMDECDLVTNEVLDGLDVVEKMELINDRAYDAWQKRWNESSNGRVTYEWIPDVRFSAQNAKFEPSLKVCYILTGHGSLNAFLFERRLSETPSCVCGHEKEDWLHVLVECDMYAAFRDLDDMNVVRKENGWDVSLVLKAKETYERMSAFVERVYRMRASVTARLNDDDDRLGL